MSERSDHLTDDAITQFLRTRSADAELGLLDDIVRTVGATAQDRPWFGLRPILLPRRTLLIVAIASLLAMMGAIAVGSRLVQPNLPGGAFLGTWVTTELDGSTPTMVIRASGGDEVEIEVHDDLASVCSGAASTMTGTGQVRRGTELVVPSPTFVCDDGSEPESLSGPSLEQQLRNLTFVRDAEAERLTDNLGGVWLREGAAAVSPTPQPSEHVAPPSEAEVTALLSGFLEARVAGEGAHQYLNSLYPEIPADEIPLLYATSSGAPYERGEFEPVPGIEWPYGFMAFKLRLFAGETVVEQLFFMPHDDPEYFPADGRLGLEYQPHGFATLIPPTTEDGRPLALPYDYFDGAVTVHAAHPWVFHDGWPGGRLIPEGPAVGPTTDGGQRREWDELVLMADPAPVEVQGGCQTGPPPADAEALAESIRSYPLEATAPVAVRAGAVEGVMMDVKIGAGAIICAPADRGGDLEPGILNPVFNQDGSALVHDGLITGVATGEWMRLYLFDAPEGSSIRILAMAVVAPESRFERAVEAAVAVVDSVEFHAP